MTDSGTQPQGPANLRHAQTTPASRLGPLRGSHRSTSNLGRRTGKAMRTMRRRFELARSTGAQAPIGRTSRHRLQSQADRRGNLFVADRAGCARTRRAEPTVGPRSRKALAPSSAVSWLPIPSRSAIAVFVAPSAAIRKIRAGSAGAQLPQAHPVPRPIKLSQPPPCHAPSPPPS
jgi:hypothetical protein